MSYEYDDGRNDHSSRYYDDRRYQRDPRYAESRDSYTKGQVTSRALIPRSRDDSDLSVEEIRRDFPPPTYMRNQYGDYYYDDDRRSRAGKDRDRDRDRDRNLNHGQAYRDDKKFSKGASYDDEKKRRRMLSKQDKILAAVIGGALAVGGKELYDRHEAHQEGHHHVQRNALNSAMLGAAGALAAYQGADYYNKHAGKESRKQPNKSRGGSYSDSGSDSEDARTKKGSNNFLESALAAAGLGGAIKALAGGDGGGGGDSSSSTHNSKRSDTRSHRGGSRSTSRSRSGSRGASSRSGEKGGSMTSKIQKTAVASLLAGATEAFRIAKEPGGWKGEKAKRVVTAAIGAATLDAAQGEKHGKMGLAESVIGGLLGNRLVNGSRRNIEEDRQTGRSRSRSRAHSDRRSSSGNNGGGGSSGGVSGLAALASAGLGALAAKKIADKRSDSRSQSRRRHSDDRDDRDDHDRSHRSRSRSVVDTARRSLAKLGIGNEPDSRDRDGSSGRKRASSRRDRRSESPDSYDGHSTDRRSDRDRDSDRDRNYGKSRGNHSARDRSTDRSQGAGRGGRDDYHDDDSDDYDNDPHRNRHRRVSSSRHKDRSRSAGDGSDLGSSTEDEKKAKKMRGKQVITTGLAAVATIHAAHSVYQSIEKREARKRAVHEGRLSPEDARKLKNKALLKDAASIGIAALSIKGAVSELKEVREVNHELKEFQRERARRHARRLERRRGARSPSAPSPQADKRRSTSALPCPDSGDGPVYTDLPHPPVGGDTGYLRGIIRDSRDDYNDWSQEGEVHETPWKIRADNM